MEYSRTILGAILIHSFLLVFSQAYTKINEFSDQRAWIRLCKSGGGENILGVEAGSRCSSGFWFKDPLKVSCACGHGVWVFAKGWCDRSARVVVALNGSCFSVDKDVRYIRNIGAATDAFSPFHFQTTVGFEYVQEIPVGFDYSFMNMNYDQHIGAIFRSKDLESVNSRKCLERDDPAKKAIAMKYYTEKVPYQQVEECFRPHGQANNFTFDEGFSLKDFFVLKEKAKEGMNRSYIPSANWVGNDTKCATECLGNGASTTPKPASPPATTPFVTDYFDPASEDWNITAMEEQPMCNHSLKTYSLTPKTVREITEQTKRMIMANVGSSLKGITTPRVKVEDYKYFQMARHVLLKVCPNEEVPHSLVTGLLRMFRVALKESLKFYPYTMRGDGNQTERITTSLKTCLDTARPFSFEYINLTADSSEEVLTTTPNPLKQCEMKFDKTTFSYGTTDPMNRTLYSGMPEELRSDLGSLDLVIETAWKTVMLSHYYCSRHFKHNVSDYSSFYDKMDQFFNRWIQHRWLSPGPSQKAYEFAFQSFDLKRFAVNLDRCVSASRSFSHYRKWIKRPISFRRCGRNMFEDLEDKTEPRLDPTLDVITPKLTAFGNSAYCLPFWHSPVSNPGINYDPFKDGHVDGCVRYDANEWEDNLIPSTSQGWINSL